MAKLVSKYNYQLNEKPRPLKCNRFSLLKKYKCRTQQISRLHFCFETSAGNQRRQMNDRGRKRQEVGSPDQPLAATTIGFCHRSSSQANKMSNHQLRQQVQGINCMPSGREKTGRGKQMGTTVLTEQRQRNETYTHVRTRTPGQGVQRGSSLSHTHILQV